MKYNSTISFPGSKPGMVMSRKSFYGLVAGLVVLVGVCYGFYLHQMTHVGWLRSVHLFSSASSAAKTSPVTADVTAAKPVTPASSTIP